MNAMLSNLLVSAFLLSTIGAQTPAPQAPVAPIPASADQARTVLAAMPVQPPVAGGTALRVIDGMTQQPVAGADVYAIGETDDPEVARKVQALAPDHTAVALVLAAVRSTRHRTGDDGTVRVDAAARGGFLVIAGDRIGIGRSGQRVPIEIYAVQALDVVVRSAGGKPVRGAPVGVGRSSGGQQVGPEPQCTDRDGRIHIVVDRMLGMDVFVGVLGAFALPCEQKVDLRKPRTEPVVLTLPPSGQVRFILYGPDERPASGIGFARLSLVGGAAAGGDVRRQRSTTATPSEYAADNVLFGCVEVGHDVAVTVEVAGMAKPLVFQGKGPTLPGELVVVDGRLTVGPPILSFRVVDQQGQPVAKERVGFVVRGENHYRISDTETDADGRIVLPLQGTDDSDLWVLRRRVSPSTDYRGAVHRVLGTIGKGPQELGDLRLVDEPVVARGRLVDGDRRPIAGVWLSCRASAPSGNGGGSWTSGYWFFEHRVQTAADGTFEVREVDPLPGGWVMTTEGADWVAPGGIALQAERQAVQEFRLWQPTRIAARLAGAELPGFTADAVLVHRETGDELRSQFRDGVLPPVTGAAGTYDLKIGPPEFEFTIADIRAPAGGPADDSRLGAIALPEGLLIVRATVVDESDQPVPDAPVWCNLPRAGGGSGGRAVRTGQDGRVAFLARAKDCTVAIRGGGFEAQTITTLSPEMRIRVVRVAPVQVKVEGLPELLPEVRIHLACTFAGATRATTVELNDGRAVLPLDQRGTWNVRLMPGFMPATKVDPLVHRQVAEQLGGTTIEFEVEATGSPTEPKALTLTKEQHDDLVERIQAVKDILAEQKGK